jgi:CRP-like cAMP-binding protein
MKTHAMLASLPDAGRITVHAGQVLLYPRHTPPGLFVVLAGVLRRFAEGTVPEAGCGDLLDSASGVFAVPAPDEVGEPVGAGVVAQTDVELLFVPRSVVLRGEAVSLALAASGVVPVPLRESVKRREQSPAARRAR